MSSSVVESVELAKSIFLAAPIFPKSEDKKV